MNIITVDGKTYEVKYMQNKENVTVDVSTSVFRYPDFVGSKLYQNSTSSDKYSLTFAIHRTLFVGLKESLKKFVADESEAIDHPTYGKLTNIVLEHDLWGAIKGKIVGSITYNTSSEADIICSCVFHEHTEDTPISKKNIQDLNTESVEAIDLETTANFDVDLSTQDKSALSKFADNLSSLYNNIQNSAVVSAFNDLNAELNAAVLDSQRIINAYKKIIALPNQVLFDIRSKIDLLQKQTEAIRNITISSANLAIFNANLISYNMGITSQTAFISESALEAAAGIKAVPLNV